MLRHQPQSHFQPPVTAAQPRSQSPSSAFKQILALAIAPEPPAPPPGCGNATQGRRGAGGVHRPGLGAKLLCLKPGANVKSVPDECSSEPQVAVGHGGLCEMGGGMQEDRGGREQRLGCRTRCDANPGRSEGWQERQRLRMGEGEIHSRGGEGCSSPFVGPHPV